MAGLPCFVVKLLACCVQSDVFTDFVGDGLAMVSLAWREVDIERNQQSSQAPDARKIYLSKCTKLLEIAKGSSESVIRPLTIPTNFGFSLDLY